MDESMDGQMLVLINMNLLMWMDKWINEIVTKCPQKQINGGGGGERKRNHITMDVNG